MKKQITKDKWIWMPHAAHFIMGSDCQFFLATRIGKYIVSTVGEYFPDEGIREIYAQSRGIKLEGKGDARRYDYMKKLGFEEIGYGRKYETMVFRAIPMPFGKCASCPFKIESGDNLDFSGYNTSKDAYKGHMKMCLKWSRR